jgi:cell division protein FtsL
MDRKPPRKKPNNIIEMKRGDTIHRINPQNRRLALSTPILFTILLIFIGALSSAAASAHMTNTRREVSLMRQTLNNQLDANRILAGQLPQPYTLEEIERMAYERFGMARPDPSQIIYINVPPVSHVVFNTDVNLLPRSTTFWEEMRAFLIGIFNRVFGG